MKLSQESKDKIREAYKKGDIFWLETIRNELIKYVDNDLIQFDLYDIEEEEENCRQIMKLMTIIKTIYNVLLDMEVIFYLEEYYDKTHDLYSEMKIDLTKMIGYEEMWEEL